MTLTFDVPSFNENPLSIKMQFGTSTFLVGANGSGKTRLAAQIESNFGIKAHRISAHRSLSLNPSVAKISEVKARAGLRFGYADAQPANGQSYRNNQRWQSKSATYLLNDFDFLVQALFAEQSNTALKTHNAAHAGNLGEPQTTNFQKLCAIWDRVLPHRRLEVTGDDIKAFATVEAAKTISTVSGDYELKDDNKAEDNADEGYSGSEMSDGERAVFYMLGQVLIAEPESVLIFDEPELHIHRAILSRLWDEVELARPDCAFLVITHELEFAASRPGQKFAVRRYEAPGKWEIEAVPNDTGFTEEVATLILGSRKPILFVEGTGSSLDLAIYRGCYPGWTIVPRGACENVIHAVATMRHNANLTRITCSGIVDADDYSDEDKKNLEKFGVSVLPVAEIENLFLLPAVASAILRMEECDDDEVVARLEALKQDLFKEVIKPGASDDAVLRYCRRRIDRTLKKIDLKDVKAASDLAQVYNKRTGELDVVAIAAEAKGRIDQALLDSDIPSLLAAFDDKALLALAAKHLKNVSKTAFESWLSRVMRSTKQTELRIALNAVLPELIAH